MQMLQALKPHDYVKKKTFFENMQEAREEDDNLENNRVFSHEVSISLNSRVKRHHVQIQGYNKIPKKL